MLFDSRIAFKPRLGELSEACRFDRYLQSRNRYKQDLLEEFLQHAADGPVLEMSNGFGTIAIELLRRKRLPLYVVCESSHARRLYQEKIRQDGLERHCRLTARQDGRLPFADGFFTLSYSVNSLHEWDDPVFVLAELHRVTRPGGLLLVNDLKRDADPYITEYVIREMLDDETADGRSWLDTFLQSLRSAYSLAEMVRLLEDSGLGGFEAETGEAMTATLRIRKRAGA